MKEEEKQRKFHEALLKMLYPPPPSPPPDQEDDEKDHEEGKDLIEPLSDLPGEELENEKSCSLPSSSNDNEGENSSALQKLTRAKRKRLRKKKLKEATSRRRKIIGPLFPRSNDDIDHICGGVEMESNVPEGVRQNAPTNVSGEPASCFEKNKNKLKQRRKSKKLAVAKLTTPSIESGTSIQNQGLKMGTDDKTDS